MNHQHGSIFGNEKRQWSNLLIPFIRDVYTVVSVQFTYFFSLLVRVYSQTQHTVCTYQFIIYFSNPLDVGRLSIANVPNRGNKNVENLVCVRIAFSIRRQTNDVDLRNGISEKSRMACAEYGWLYDADNVRWIRLYFTFKITNRIKTVKIVQRLIIIILFFVFSKNLKPFVWYPIICATVTKTGIRTLNTKTWWANAVIIHC